MIFKLVTFLAEGCRVYFPTQVTEL